jgi:phosphate transport system permease protein
MMYLKRHIKGIIWHSFAYVSFALMLLIFLAIIVKVVLMGLPALNWHLLAQITPPPGAISGGLLNALVGSLLMVIFALVLLIPIGLLTGTYLSLHKHERLSKFLQFLNDSLLSIPSIIIGLFIYAIVVVTMGHFSALAGSLALTLVGLPIVIRGTQDVLTTLPPQLKEAGFALGAGEVRVVLGVLYRSCKAGILSSFLLALARMLGETAPLLFTSLNNQFMSLKPGQPIASLPVTIFQFAMSPDANWQALAFAGAVLLMLVVLVLSLLARFLLAKNK